MYGFDHGVWMLGGWIVMLALWLLPFALLFFAIRFFFHRFNRMGDKTALEILESNRLTRVEKSIATSFCKNATTCRRSK